MIFFFFFFFFFFFLPSIRLDVYSFFEKFHKDKYKGKQCCFLNECFVDLLRQSTISVPSAFTSLANSTIVSRCESNVAIIDGVVTFD
jgi:hypothetical protein